MARRLILAVMSTAAILAGMTATMTVPAKADSVPGCFSASCDHHDPIAEGCSASVFPAADVTYDAVSYSIHIELRYSSDCGAAWARVTINDPNKVAGNYNFFVKNTHGTVDQFTAVPNTTSWTNMVDDAGTSINAEACIGSTSRPIDCTPWW